MVTLTSSTIKEDESRAGFTWESSWLPPTRRGEGFEEAVSSMWAGLEAVVQKQTPSRCPWHLEDSRLDGSVGMECSRLGFFQATN